MVRCGNPSRRAFQLLDFGLLYASQWDDNEACKKCSVEVPRAAQQAWILNLIIVIMNSVGLQGFGKVGLIQSLDRSGNIQPSEWRRYRSGCQMLRGAVPVNDLFWLMNTVLP